jgi:hypothetical protein
VEVQLRQLRNVRRDPPRLVFGEQLGHIRRNPARLIPRGRIYAAAIRSSGCSPRIYMPRKLG